MDQLSCQVNHAASARIITANEVTKTPIGKADNFLFEEENNKVPITINTKEVTNGWRTLYFVHESLRQPPYISLKYKDYEKKLLSMGA
ncbi:hypothetical protein G9A89_021157 [Geosiphon pyriformis]|nr:hypothetical protein G9A89_021157 [Geosiphon pyriformis]